MVGCAVFGLAFAIPHRHTKRPVMLGTLFLLKLMGAVALLLWATHLVRASMDRAFGMQLRTLVGRAVNGRLKACLIGMGVALGLQSSSATALVVSALAERGLVPLAAALAVMLGADVGSSLAVQILVLKSDLLISLLLIAGVTVTLTARRRARRHAGHFTVGLGLILLSLHIIVQESAVLRDAPLVMEMTGLMGGSLVVPFILGGLLTWLCHSSVAIVLLVASLAGVEVISVPLGLALVLGANVGSGLIPIGAASPMGSATKRIIVGNIGFRLIGAGIGIAALGVGADHVGRLGPSPAYQIANAHVAFNMVLALCFLPFVPAIARLLAKHVATDDAARRPHAINLHAEHLSRPELAIASAGREVMRLADKVELMLQETIFTFTDDTADRHEVIGKLEQEVDGLQKEIKHYLAHLMRQPLGDDLSRRCNELLRFTTSLEHVGDIIDQGLLKHSTKRQRDNVTFSDPGWRDIQALHGRVIAQMRLAVGVFNTRDATLAKQLMAEKDRLRQFEQTAVERHFERLKRGTVASFETSDIHLDILRDLKRITAYLAIAAHPILEAQGALRPSRLKSPT